MDYNGVLWILQKSVNGLGKTSMDVYGMFQGRRSDAKVHLRNNPCSIKGCEVTRSEIATNLRPNFNKREYTRGRAHLNISELGYLTTNPLGSVKPTDCFIRYDGLIGTRGFVI